MAPWRFSTAPSCRTRFREPDGRRRWPDHGAAFPRQLRVSRSASRIATAASPAARRTSGRRSRQRAESGKSLGADFRRPTTSAWMPISREIRQAPPRPPLWFPVQIKAGFPGPDLNRGGVRSNRVRLPSPRVEGAEFPQGVGIPAEPLALRVESGDVLRLCIRLQGCLAPRGRIDIIGRGGRHHDDAVSGSSGQDRLTGDDTMQTGMRNAWVEERPAAIPVAGGIDAKDHDAAEARGIGLQRRSDATGPPLVLNKVARCPVGVQPRLLESLQGSRSRPAEGEARARRSPRWSGRKVVLGAKLTRALRDLIAPAPEVGEDARP